MTLPRKPETIEEAWQIIVLLVNKINNLEEENKELRGRLEKTAVTVASHPVVMGWLSHCAHKVYESLPTAIPAGNLAIPASIWRWSIIPMSLCDIQFLIAGDAGGR